MGIKGLTDLIRKHAPGAITQHGPKDFVGRAIAIDASLSIYQFLTAAQDQRAILTDANGEVTNHLSGLLYRTTRMAAAGMKPAYVFDGKAPKMKQERLAQRKDARAKAQAEQEEAKSNDEDGFKYNKRQVRVTKQQNADCIELLEMMGIPIVQAPGEAEAQCAELARGGVVYAVGSEDLDTLTFDSPLLLRKLTAPDGQAKEIVQIRLADILSELDLTMDQFIDLSILLGCDYLPPLHGVGPVGAIKMMREHGSLAASLADLRAKQAQREREIEQGKMKLSKGLGKIDVPVDWPWEECKELFRKPDVIPSGQVELVWSPPDKQELTDLLIGKHNFGPARVDQAVKKLDDAYRLSDWASKVTEFQHKRKALSQIGIDGGQ